MEVSTQSCEGGLAGLTRTDLTNLQAGKPAPQSSRHLAHRSLNDDPAVQILGDNFDKNEYTTRY
jgi:hypothetical protein